MTQVGRHWSTEQDEPWDGWGRDVRVLGSTMCKDLKGGGSLARTFHLKMFLATLIAAGRDPQAALPLSGEGAWQSQGQL